MTAERIAYLISLSFPVDQKELEEIILTIKERGYLTKEDENKFYKMRFTIDQITEFLGESQNSFGLRLENKEVSYSEVYNCLERLANDSKIAFQKNKYLKIK